MARAPQTDAPSVENEKGSIKEPVSAFSKEVRHIDNAGESAKLANPLTGIPHDQLVQDAADFAKLHGLGRFEQEFRKGALVAQDPAAFETLADLDEDNKAVLRRESTHRWAQPKQLYYLVILCSLSAAVQGMDESVISGANLFFPDDFGIPQTGPNASNNQWLLGLVNGAPYLCCGLIGCWLSAPLNKYLGRRGTIFVSAFVSFITCIWQGLTNTWWHLFIARFILGFGIGPKSSTVPVYAAECAPPVIRGALVMMWQLWTAFGIMFGNVMSVAFYHVKSSHVKGLNWRLMLGSAGVPALVVMSQVYFCPESPRWLMGKGRYDKAFESLLRLRETPLQAARDLYYIHVLLEAETEIQSGRNLFLELFTVPRNRRATLASTIVMFMQQFCGVNVIAYYSSNIFTQAGATQIEALLASWGTGMINWLMAFPAVLTIDTFGRRNLLLTTFPLMAIFLLLTGGGFWIPNTGHARIAVVALGIYLFECAYSPGEGPVPFTYSAEAFPLYVRDVGMAYATSVLWFFNFLVAFTFPRLLGAFQPQGAFGWYAAWNAIGFVLVLLFLPETKALSLEELDQVFSVPTHLHAAYQLKALPHNIRKYIFRQRVDDLPPLYEHKGAIGEQHRTADAAEHA